MFITLIHMTSVLAAMTAFYALRLWLMGEGDYNLLRILTAGYMALFVIACIVGLLEHV